MLGVVVIGGWLAITSSDWITASFSQSQAEHSDAKKKSAPEDVNRVQLDVPLVNQMDAPRLYNGCEIASLTMLFNYVNVDVTKNELAAKLPSVPLDYGDGTHGNPNVGFVGDITGNNPGLGVYHGPIYKVAKTQTKQVKDLSGASFKQVIRQLEKGRPVWTVTTVSFAPVDSMETWSTPQGDVDVTYDVHSVVITGFDRDKQLIYINNPYGQKQQAVDWDNFQAAYKQLGRQAIVLTLKA